jgi:hypothetical protein
MIDTLKLSKRLQEAAMPKEQADALAEGLNAAIKENYVTNEKLDSSLLKLKTELIFWVVGTVGLGTILTHYWK